MGKYRPVHEILETKNHEEQSKRIENLIELAQTATASVLIHYDPRMEGRVLVRAVSPASVDVRMALQIIQEAEQSLIKIITEQAEAQGDKVPEAVPA